jgi:4-hydroxy-tetrahydrodipicolinate reductase
MNIKVGLFGGSGKMGRAIEQILPLLKSKNKLVPFLYIGKETSTLFSISAEKITNVEEEILKEVDVWIDFTSPEGLSQLLKATEKLKTPIVSGSTGLSKKNFSDLKINAKKRKLFWASNMSLGLWAFRQAMKSLSHISNFDFAIEEIHHTQKKDNPSGTAKTLHGDLEKIVNKKVKLQEGLRVGGVFGIHTLTAASYNEMITMQHQALNRTVFAEGALLAGHWLVSQKNGLYSMDDMLLKK